MTLFEGLVLTNLVISLLLAYKGGRQQVDIEVLYEGVAITMEELKMIAADDD